MIRPFLRYFEVSGRSSRAEYWQFVLFQALVLMGLFVFWVGIVVVSLPGSMMIPSICLGIGYVLFLLASIIPNVTVVIRRLHDANRSAWWLGLYVPGLVLAVQTLTLVIRGLDATPAEMSQMVSQTINSTVLGTASTICHLTLFVYMVLPGTKGTNRFGEAPVATTMAVEVAKNKPEIAPETTEPAPEAAPVARRISLSNLPLQPVRSTPRPSPKPIPLIVPVAAMKSLAGPINSGPYSPGIKPTQPFGRRGMH